jgi:diguanylate cyclase (GGDEF)-like protein
VVIGDRDRLPDELSLTSRDSRGYLRRPAKPDEVVDEAQRVLRRLRPQRGRILAVDDDPQVLEFVRSLLERDGFAVHAVGDPLELIAQLDLEPADLLILDLDMPYMSGIELCRLVRADSRWHGVPVVLLTANREADVVERVFAAGADDFVLKPLVGPELTTRVVNRLERNRLYRTMAETDFLTGVSNRRRSTELFEQLRRLAIRHHQPLCFAILDLDKFKQVNDAYGHAVGDTVLREFAAFLLRTFRGEDIVGRWGGEEFVLGTYGMDRKTGMRRIEAAIEEFGSHPIDDSAGGELRVTFSAGIAQHGPDGTDLQSLYLAADEALYRAKSDGRATVRAATDGEATRLASPDHPVRAPGRRPSVRS